MRTHAAARNRTELGIVFGCLLVFVIFLSLCGFGFGFGLFVYLVVELERELNLPWIPRLVGKSKCGLCQVRADVVETKSGVIQQIKKLRSKLQARSFGQCKVLEH